MLGVLGQQALLQRVDALLVAGGVQLGALLHGGVGRPALGIHDVGILEGFLHVVGLVELGAVLLAVLAGDLLHLGHDVIALGMGQRHIHAKAGEQADDALRYGQRLAVGGRVGPGHGDLLALQVLHAAEVVDDMEHIGHALGGVIHVALQVDQRGLLLQNTVAVALLHGVHEGLLILVALADEHIVADADDIGHEGHHVGRLADSLAVGDLGLLLVQILHLQAQQVAGGGEGEAGTGGVVAEDGDAQTGIEHAGALVALTQVAEGVGHGEDGVDLVIGLVPSPIEIVLVHIVDVQGGQMTCQLNSLAHFLFSPYKK